MCVCCVRITNHHYTSFTKQYRNASQQHNKRVIKKAVTKQINFYFVSLNALILFFKNNQRQLLVCHLLPRAELNVYLHTTNLIYLRATIKIHAHEINKFRVCKSQHIIHHTIPQYEKIMICQKYIFSHNVRFYNLKSCLTLQNVALGFKAAMNQGRKDFYHQNKKKDGKVLPFSKQRTNIHNFHTKQRRFFLVNLLNRREMVL